MHHAAACFSCVCGAVLLPGRLACAHLRVLYVCAAQVDPGQHNVAYEARLFKRMFLKLREE